MLRRTILLLVLVVAVAAEAVQVLLLVLPWRCKRRQQGRRSHLAVASVNDCEPRLSVRFFDVEFCGRRLQIDDNEIRKKTWMIIEVKSFV